MEHEHILSGILKCPICGKGMYGNVNRKKKKDGTFYKDYFYYACKHRYYVNGHKCDYRKQWNEEKVNDAVAEVIKKLVNNPKFEAAIRAKINSKIDTGELETEHENLKKQLRQVLGAKNRLGQQMDNLDISDKMYDRKYQDMQDRLNGLYDEIERLESLIDDIVSRKEYIRQQKISEDGVYQYLLYFDKLYDKFTDMEKKEFMNSFVERVDIYEDEQPNGRFLKHIKFKFPVFFDGEEIQELSWDNETTVEAITVRWKWSSGTKGKGIRIMNLVTAEHLTKSYTERLILNDTDFSINEGDKIGLIGVNGTGKSTLLKLAGYGDRCPREEPGYPLSSPESGV